MSYFTLTIVIILIAVIVYYGNYTPGIPFITNLFAVFSWVAMKLLLGKGEENDKKRVTAIRSLITPPRTKLPKIKGLVADVTSVTVRDGAQIDVFTYTPESILHEKEPKKHQLIFFCHGGGWVMANRWSNEGIICKYALKTNSVVTYLNYRLSPQYTHPTAVYDCYDCLLYLREHHEEFHFDLDHIVLMGDSAGGQICCSIVQLAREQFNRCIFSKMVLIYPAMDSRAVPEDDPTWPERNEIYDKTFGFSYHTGYVMSKWYFVKQENVDSKFGSPCLEDDFEFYPPTRFFTCEFDTLKIAAKATYERMKNAGIDVKYTCVKGGIHAIWGARLYDCGINDMILKELEMD